MGLDGRPMIVTGGSLGIGRAIASSLGRDGARVAANRRTGQIFPVDGGLTM